MKKEQLTGAKKLRVRARDLKLKADGLIKEADKLIQQAEELEKKTSSRREDVNQAAARILRQATE
jgi:hypothetical protein